MKKTPASLHRLQIIVVDKHHGTVSYYWHPYGFTSLLAAVRVASQLRGRRGYNAVDVYPAGSCERLIAAAPIDHAHPWASP